MVTTTPESSGGQITSHIEERESFMSCPSPAERDRFASRRVSANRLVVLIPGAIIDPPGESGKPKPLSRIADLKRSGRAVILLADQC